MKVLIFGAQSTIAQELQKIWAHKGYTIVLVGRNEGELLAISQDLAVRGGKSGYRVIDLCKFNEAEGFVNKLWAEYLGFDLVFMAHGFLGEQREDERSTGATLKILESNFVSHAVFLTPVADLMERQKHGIIAVITSVAGIRGKRSNYIYGSAKAGKIAFLEGLRGRLFRSGVHVVDLRLGFVDTVMTKKFKKGHLWVSPFSVAKTIDAVICKNRDIAYIPFFWLWIMLVIRCIPGRVFKRMGV